MDCLYGVVLVVIIQEAIAQFPRAPLAPTGTGIGRRQSVFLGPDPTQLALPGARGLPGPVPGLSRCPGDRRIPGIQCGQVSGRMDCPTGSRCMTDSTDRFSYCCWDEQSPVESPCDDPLVDNGVFRTCNTGEGDGTGCPAPCHACRPLSSTGMGACCPQITRPGCERSSPARNEFLRQREMIQGSSGSSTGTGTTSSGGGTTSMEASVSAGASGGAVSGGAPRVGAPVIATGGAPVARTIQSTAPRPGVDFIATRGAPVAGTVQGIAPRPGVAVIATGGTPVAGTVQGIAPRPGTAAQPSVSLGSLPPVPPPQGARLSVDALPPRTSSGSFTAPQAIPPEVGAMPGNILPPPQPRGGVIPAGSPRTISPVGGAFGGTSVCGPGVRPVGTCTAAGICGMGYRCVGVGVRYGVCCPLPAAVMPAAGRTIPGMTPRARGGSMFPTGFTSGFGGFRRRDCPPPMFQRCIRMGRPQCFMDAQCPRPLRCCSPSPRCLARCM